MMPDRPALTPAFLRSVRPPAAGQIEHADGGCPGLRLRLSHGGAATWVLGCRDAAGKPRRFVLGAFPAVGLARARELARERREEVRQGRDPVREARQAREEAAAPAPHVVTLAAVLDGYAKDVGSRRRSWPEARRRIASVFAAHLDADAGALTAPALQLTVDWHRSRTSAGAAVRYIRPVLKWGAKRGLLARGIGEALDQPEGALAVRQRRLTRDEVAAILPVLDQAGSYGRAMRWLFRTGCRLNEACAARWQDVNLATGLWTVPRTKQGREHVVPLPDPALAMLRDMLPPGGAADPGALVFANERGGPLANWDRATKAIHAASKTGGWHRHDIRRTVASIMGDLGVAPHVIEVCLGHALHSSSDGSSLSRVATVYNRSRYQREHAYALAQLAAELDRIEKGSANVVRLVRA
jgi:integrase